MCLDDPGSYSSWDLGSWWLQPCWTGFGLKTRRIATPSPPGRGLSHGFMFHPVKKIITTESKHTLSKKAVRLEEKGGGL